MAVVLLVGGLAIAPTMIGAMTMVEQGVPPSRLTEGMAILHTGIVAGVAPGREHRRASSSTTAARPRRTPSRSPAGSSARSSPRPPADRLACAHDLAP